MGKRYVVIWFRYLVTDWMVRRQPELKHASFVTAAPEHGRMVVKTSSITAQLKGILPGMVVADCRAIEPGLQVFDHRPEVAGKLLHALAEWCIRFTPSAAVDMPDGLVLDVTGCAHLWGGEEAYLNDITSRIKAFGYRIRAAIADTVGCAWAIARFGKVKAIVPPGEQAKALLPLPPSAFRLEMNTVKRLERLGLHQLQSIIGISRTALRRRFGPHLLTRLDQAFGREAETIRPVCPAEPYQERLPSLEPVRSAVGIETALTQLLEKLCKRLEREGKGLRSCLFKCYRMDGHMQQISIATGRASRSIPHLFKLFENKISLLEPDLGFELFILESPLTEELSSHQEALWNDTVSQNKKTLAELLDRIADRSGMHVIHRYLPDEHYWPERSIRLAKSLDERPAAAWRTDLPRPVHLLPEPESIEVTVPVPDYPPMLFRYKGVLHKVVKADGPERIEQEWWLQQGLSRDYYCVEDEKGGRYWLFRSGQYDKGGARWFVHGFFA